jgi:hypothetical protein
MDEGFGGKFSEVSFERLMRFLTAIGCRIEIKMCVSAPAFE